MQTGRPGGKHGPSHGELHETRRNSGMDEMTPGSQSRQIVIGAACLGSTNLSGDFMKKSRSVIFYLERSPQTRKWDLYIVRDGT